MYVLDEPDLARKETAGNKQIKLIGNETTNKANEMPQRSNITDYENIINKTQ